MRIRDEQIEELKKVPLQVFEDEMVVHLAEFSPPLFQAVKEEQLRKVIRFGIAQADTYGITFRGPIRLYLELMLLFGSHFDTDPQYSWAGEILRDKDSAPQMERSDHIYEKTLDYRKKVAGDQDAYTLKALRRIADLAQKPLAFPSGDRVNAMLTEMRDVYPEKAEYLGEATLRLLINRGLAIGERYRFSSDHAVALPVVLMFAFGHGCFEDPLYPWIEKTMNDEAITDPEARARRLEKKALTWLNHVLAYFDEDENE